MMTKRAGHLLELQQGAVDSQDDYQTPPWALEMLYPYLPQSWVIWECCVGQGNLVGALRERGYRCIGTDILTGYDALVWSPHAGWDMLLTNPPFSLKDEFLELAYDLVKPFALLLPLTCLGGRKRHALYARYGVQLIVPDRRIEFEVPGAPEKKAPWFPSGWFTWGLGLESDLTLWNPDASSSSTTSRNTGRGRRCGTAARTRTILTIRSTEVVE